MPTNFKLPNWESVANNWTAARDMVRGQWGILTREDLDRINGNRQRLREILETDYHLSRLQADREIDEFLRSQSADTFAM